MVVNRDTLHKLVGTKRHNEGTSGTALEAQKKAAAIV